ERVGARRRDRRRNGGRGNPGRARVSGRGGASGQGRSQRRAWLLRHAGAAPTGGGDWPDAAQRPSSADRRAVTTRPKSVTKLSESHSGEAKTDASLGGALTPSGPAGVTLVLLPRPPIRGQRGPPGPTTTRIPLGLRRSPDRPCVAPGRRCARAPRCASLARAPALPAHRARRTLRSRNLP